MRHNFVISVGYASAMALGCVSMMAAADEVTPSEQAYLQEFPVVLSASRLSQPLADAPNAMTVIDRQMIKASGFRTIADLFRLVPGMYVGNTANMPIITLHGVSDQYSRRMQVLVDGRSVYLPPFGGVDWQDLPLLIDDIERIEVVRGPAAASHGANSFYGVINIITRDAASDNGNSVKVNKGGMGIADATAFLDRTGEDIDYRLSFGYRADGGDNPQIVNDTSSNRLFNLRSNYRLDFDDSVELQVGLNYGTYGMGTMGQYMEAFRVVSTSNDFQQLTWIHSWGEDESKLVWYRINRDFKDPYRCIDFPLCKNGTPVSLGFGQDNARSMRQELELQNTTQLGADHRSVWGAGMRHDYADQPLLFATPRSLHQARVFVHDEWRMTEATLLNAGFMYEDDGAGHRNTSPRLSLNHHFLPQHTLRVSVSRAARNPVMAELYMATETGKYHGDGYSPPAGDLRPEKILSRELGYVGQFDRLRVDGRIYYDKVSDIVWIDGYADLSNPADPKHSFKNLFNGTFKGLDISASYPWQDGSLTVNFSRQQTTCAFSDYPTQYSSPLPISATMTLGQYLAQIYQAEYLGLCGETVPANSGSVLWSQQLSDTLQFSAGYYARSKVRVGDVSAEFPPESEMHRVDLRMASSFGRIDKIGGGEIAVVLQNAFRDNYTGHGNVPQRVGLLFQRRAYLTATFNF